MNRRELFKSASALAVMGVLPSVSFAQTHGATSPDAGPRETLSLNKGWRFFDGDIAMPLLINHDDAYNAAKAGHALGAAAPAFDDSQWARITLPHDFVSFQPIVKDANVDQGYRKRGVVWYRNTLIFTPADRGKHLELQLDGIATFATIWFNGTLVARNWSGYTSNYIDLTAYAEYDKPNHLAIRVDASAMEGWWYEGGGLYRDAWIVKRSPVHIVTDGVFANPVAESGTDYFRWALPVEVTVFNSGATPARVHAETVIKDMSGLVVGREVSEAMAIAPLDNGILKLELSPPEVGNWSPDNPVLYNVTTRLIAADAVLDATATPCGFRMTKWDAQKGFYLNGQPLKIKGVCLHQDHAGVGTAVPLGVIEYRLRRLKELGCNAIRFSHNAQNKALMDACDRHGFLVMAENRNFNASPDYLKQLEWLVRRDRNHPSIYLWSVFNEEPMQATEQGYEMVRRMSAVVKALDTTRPVTAAMNGGLEAPLSVAHAVDVVGINYQQDHYDSFHAAHPDIPMFSSEDTSAFMTRGAYRSDKDAHVMACYDDEAAPWGETHRAAWKAVQARPFVAGTFVWTGFDYHGEPTPFTWPSNSSYFGIMDLCGFEKAAFWIHQAQWIDDKPVLGLVPHWNWTKGERVRVMACTNADEVELFVNGKSAGRQKGDRLDMNYWQVAYTPGYIEARAYTAGKLVARVRNETTGPAVALKMVPDRRTLTGDGCDAMPIKVIAVDAKGRTVVTAHHKVKFEGTADIIGLGNGDPTCLEPEKGNSRSLFNGLAQVVVQAKDIMANPTGLITLSASAEGLKPTAVEISLDKPSAPIGYQVTA